MEYAENLINYLGTARKTSTISSSDLDNAISKITGSTILTAETIPCPSIVGNPGGQLDTSIEQCPQQPFSFQPGEHVAFFWVENNNDVVWYLCIVECMLNEKFNIIHLQRSDKQGMKWLLPDNPETRPVDHDQILLRNISVMYYGLSCRIEISKVVTGEIQDLVTDLSK